MPDTDWMEIIPRYFVNLVYWTMPSHPLSFCLPILITALAMIVGIILVGKSK